MQYHTNSMMGGTVEETPLAQACARGFLEIVKLLILNGADVNYLCLVCLQILLHWRFYTGCNTIFIKLIN